MALHRPVTISLLLRLFLVIQLHYTLGLSSSRGATILTAPPPEGICSAAVTIHGYKCQEFTVTTDDGYILSVQRIGGGGQSKPPVLLQHGVLVDGMIWLVNPPDKSLVFILANNGFDVWITNTRGTRFSNRHTTLSPSNPEIWNWTWDDLVVHDLPAVIDFVFKQSGQKINYVGHSMGSLLALASFSERKEVEKVKSAVLLGPVAYLSHMTSPLGQVAARAFIGEITQIFGLAEFNPVEKHTLHLIRVLCAVSGIDCYNLLTALTGKNCCLNSSTVDIFFKNEPQPTSTKIMIHFAQTFRDGTLSKYDYGKAQYNFEHYGVTKPPTYNLSNIPHDLPLFLSYGGRDALSDVRDVETLLDSLRLHNPKKLSIQYLKDFAHADFVLGVTAKDLVFNQMIRFFREQT